MIDSTSSTGLEAGLLDALHSVLDGLTEIALRLQGIPESVVSAVCSFPTLEDAVNRFSGLDYPVRPTAWATGNAGFFRWSIRTPSRRCARSRAHWIHTIS